MRSPPANRPTPLETHGKPTLELVRRLAPEPTQLGDRVTGASASPDGRYVVVRTYAGAFEWRGPRGYVELRPEVDPAQIFVLHR